MLDTHAIQRKKEIDQQVSTSSLSRLLFGSVQNTVNTMMTHLPRNNLSQQQINNAALTNSALAVAGNFNPNDNQAFLSNMRGVLGAPSTRTILPVPIKGSDGKLIKEIDLRAVNGQKASHREKNNRLGRNPGVLSSATLRPYKAAFEVAPAGKAIYPTDRMNEEEQLKLAKENSMATYEDKQEEMTRAIRLSLLESNSTGTAHHHPVTVNLLSPSESHSASDGISILSTPKRPSKVDHYLRRVQKKAFKHSQKTVEVLNLEDDSETVASPEVKAASPYSSKVYYALSNRKKDPALADFITDFHEENPQADSQEGYTVASGFLRDMDGVPKKAGKKSNKRRL